MSSPAAPSHPAHILLSRAHPPELASTIFIDKVIRKPLTLRPTSPDPSSQNARSHRRLLRLRKNERALRRSKPKPLSAKEKRALGIYDIPKAQQKYELYVPLHKLWLGYVREILGLKEGEKGFVTAASAGAILASADFHGAEVEVVRSRCVGRVGCKGIVVKDTKFTFEVITGENSLKVVPKEHTIFRFEIPQQIQTSKEVMAARELRGDAMNIDSCAPLVVPLIFELHGSQFENRATDRATKKFKQRRMDHL